jgi:hypothetical protein
MRADCLALCLRLFANRVTGRERYIAPSRPIPNFERTGGWASISDGVEVLAGMRWVGGGALSVRAGTEPLPPAQSGLFRSAPSVQTNMDSPESRARQRSDKPPENSESQPKPRRTAAVKKDSAPARSLLQIQVTAITALRAWEQDMLQWK